MCRIYAGIIAYNPDIDRLRDNISSVLPQVQGLIVVDNGSKNLNDVRKLIEELQVELQADTSDSVSGNSDSGANGKIQIVENSENKGVAYALNQIMHEAVKYGRADWVLTLDQDTVVYDNLVGMYRSFIDGKISDKSQNGKVINADKIASITCLRHDRNYVEKNVNGGGKADSDCEWEYVESCITSGNLISVCAWKKVHGFDNRLFIDMVDDEYCYRLRECGYHIVRINSYGFLHELGENLKTVKFFGREKTIFAYSPKRKYYTARNTIYMIRRYKLGIVNEYSKYLSKRFVGTLLYEKNKLRGLSAYFKGFFAGFKLDCTK